MTKQEIRNKMITNDEDLHEIFFSFEDLNECNRGVKSNILKNTCHYDGKGISDNDENDYNNDSYRKSSLELNLTCNDINLEPITVEELDNRSSKSKPMYFDHGFIRGLYMNKKLSIDVISDQHVHQCFTRDIGEEVYYCDVRPLVGMITDAQKETVLQSMNAIKSFFKAKGRKLAEEYLIDYYNQHYIKQQQQSKVTTFADIFARENNGTNKITMVKKECFENMKRDLDKNTITTNVMSEMNIFYRNEKKGKSTDFICSALNKGICDTFRSFDIQSRTRCVWRSCNSRNTKTNTLDTLCEENNSEDSVNDTNDDYNVSNASKKVKSEQVTLHNTSMSFNQIKKSELKKNDILSSRGVAFSKNPGNVRFRELVFKYKPLYEENPSYVYRRALAKDIVDNLSPGRFVKMKVMDDKHGIVLDYEQSITKALFAMRDCKRSKKKVMKVASASIDGKDGDNKRKFDTCAREENTSENFASTINDEYNDSNNPNKKAKADKVTHLPSNEEAGALNEVKCLSQSIANFCSNAETYLITPGAKHKFLVQIQKLSNVVRDLTEVISSQHEKTSDNDTTIKIVKENIENDGDNIDIQDTFSTSNQFLQHTFVTQMSEINVTDTSDDNNGYCGIVDKTEMELQKNPLKRSSNDITGNNKYHVGKRTTNVHDLPDLGLNLSFRSGAIEIVSHHGANTSNS